MDEAPKGPKQRKAISPERKKVLLENLAKARARAAEVRKEKKARASEQKARKEKSAEPVAPVAEPPKPDPRDAEIERLRNQVKNFTLQDIAKKSKPKPKPKRPDTPPPPPVENEIVVASGSGD